MMQEILEVGKEKKKKEVGTSKVGPSTAAPPRCSPEGKPETEEAARRLARAIYWIFRAQPALQEGGIKRLAGHY